MSNRENSKNSNPSSVAAAFSNVSGVARKLVPASPLSMFISTIYMLRGAPMRPDTPAGMGAAGVLYYFSNGERRQQ